MVEFAAVLVNRYEVGRDGKTPYERARGKRSKLLGLEFGEYTEDKGPREVSEAGYGLGGRGCSWAIGPIAARRW